MELSDHPRSVPIHRDRNIAAALVAIIGFLAAWAAALLLWERGVTSTTVNVVTLMLALFAPLAIMIAVYGVAGVIDAAAWIVRPPEPCSAACEAVTFFQLGAAFSLGFGFVGTLIGLVIMLMQLDHPRQLGPGTAMVLLSQLEGIVIAVGYIAAAAHVARRHGGMASLAPVARRSASVAGITVIAGTLTTLAAFFILRLSICPAL